TADTQHQRAPVDDLPRPDRRSAQPDMHPPRTQTRQPTHDPARAPPNDLPGNPTPRPTQPNPQPDTAADTQPGVPLSPACHAVRSAPGRGPKRRDAASVRTQCAASASFSSFSSRAVRVASNSMTS